MTMTDREYFGRLVRQIWVAAVIELVPDPKPSWLTTWAELDDEFQREVDMRIGEALFAAGREAERRDWLRSMQTKLEEWGGLDRVRADEREAIIRLARDHGAFYWGEPRPCDCRADCATVCREQLPFADLAARRQG